MTAQKRLHKIKELLLLASACLLIREVDLQTTYPFGLGGNSDFEYSVFDASAALNKIVVAGTCDDIGMCSKKPIFAEYYNMSPIARRWSR